LCNGDVKNALFFFNKTIDASVSSIVVIRALIKHFKLIEKIQCEVQNGNHIDNIMKNIKPNLVEVLKKKVIAHLVIDVNILT